MYQRQHGSNIIRKRTDPIHLSMNYSLIATNTFLTMLAAIFGQQNWGKKWQYSWILSSKRKLQRKCLKMINN